MSINNKKLKSKLLILILLRILILILNNKFSLYIMIWKVNQDIIIAMLYVAITIIISKIILSYNNRKILKYMVNILAVGYIIVILFATFIMNSDISYFKFKSPNKDHTLVVEEQSFLLAGYSKFYERKYLIFIKKLDQSISTDDGYKPFSSNDYKLEWIGNNSVKITYGFGSMGIKKNETIKFN